MSIEDCAAKLQHNGYCVLKAHYAKPVIDTCREAFWPILSEYIDRYHDSPNRHFLPMPFERPCFAPEFFFDPEVVGIVRQHMDERVVADQWGCDVPLKGSINQGVHADYRRPLFPDAPDLTLPTYMLVVSFGLIDITLAHGPIEIAAGTHRMPRNAAMEAVEVGAVELQPVPMEIGDVLIRHPWALHRGTPNITDVPRAFVTIRYVRRWYADDSREVNAIPQHIWQALSSEQRNMMRFPVLD